MQNQGNENESPMRANASLEIVKKNTCGWKNGYVCMCMTAEEYRCPAQASVNEFYGTMPESAIFPDNNVAPLQGCFF